MTGEILVQYDAVYTKIAELRNRLNTELHEMDATYRQVRTMLRGMDGRTNAVFMETMEENQKKARITADTLNKLISFMETSARHVEQEEMILKRMFSGRGINNA